MAGSGNDGDGGAGTDGAARLRELEERLAALRARMEAGLPARARELREAADRLGTDPGARETIRRAAHKLRGVAGTHGRAELGEEAARVEALARDAAEEGTLGASTRALADAIERAEPTARTAPAAAPGRARAPAPAGPKRLAGTTIAVLDDDESTRRLLELTLGPMGGARTHVLEHASALYEAVRRERVDLVVLDAMMPDATGLEVMLALRAEHGEDAPRCALLSAATAAELEWELDPAMGIIWLRKPFRPSELVDAIARALGR